MASNQTSFPLANPIEAGYCEGKISITIAITLGVCVLLSIVFMDYSLNQLQNCPDHYCTILHDLVLADATTQEDVLLDTCVRLCMNGAFNYNKVSAMAGTVKVYEHYLKMREGEMSISEEIGDFPPGSEMALRLEVGDKGPEQV